MAEARFFRISSSFSTRLRSSSACWWRSFLALLDRTSSKASSLPVRLSVWAASFFATDEGGGVLDAMWWLPAVMMVVLLCLWVVL